MVPEPDFELTYFILMNQFWDAFYEYFEYD